MIWGSVNGRLFQSLVTLIQARKRTPALHAEAPAYAVWTHNEAVFGLLRESPRGRILVLGNFSEKPQTVPAYRLQNMYFGGQLVDCITQRPIEGWHDVQLEPYESLWLQAIVEWKVKCIHQRQKLPQTKTLLFM